MQSLACNLITELSLSYMKEYKDNQNNLKLKKTGFPSKGMILLLFLFSSCSNNIFKSKDVNGNQLSIKCKELGKEINQDTKNLQIWRSWRNRGFIIGMMGGGAIGVCIPDPMGIMITTFVGTIIGGMIGDVIALRILKRDRDVRKHQEVLNQEALKAVKKKDNRQKKRIQTKRSNRNIYQ